MSLLHLFLPIYYLYNIYYIQHYNSRSNHGKQNYIV
nr:MAG TPA: hypothetical protein [Caudoviricetes sp.]